LRAKSSYLERDELKADDPLANRSLLITASAYRLWASTRLHDLEPWIATWATKEMFAGVPGVGASDAWYSTATIIEHSTLHDIPLMGGSADIRKCFDEIQRPLLYILAHFAGIPLPILRAYTMFIENLTIHNNLVGNIGKPHKRKCGIPQGCPLSMMFVALLLRPWIFLAKYFGAIPRILADDILIITTAKGHLQSFTATLNATHLYLHNIGARVASNKSYNFSTSKLARQSLAKHLWTNVDGKIAVITHGRDLGAHFNFTTGNRSTTITQRIDEAIRMCQRLRFLPISIHDKIKLIHTAVLPKALYATEASHITEACMTRLRTAIIDTIGTHAANRCMAMCFPMYSPKTELDPWLTAFANQIVTFRRMYYKHPELQKMMQANFLNYSQAKYAGTCQGTEHRAALTPSPSPGHPDYHRWKPHFVPHGPIGLMLSAAHRFALTINSKFTCSSKTTPSSPY